MNKQANDTQHGGNHYKDLLIEPWDYALANNLGSMEAEIIDYITRWRKKGGVEDLKKVIHYAQKLIEVAELGYPGAVPAHYFADMIRRKTSSAHVPEPEDGEEPYESQAQRRARWLAAYQCPPDAPRAEDVLLDLKLGSGGEDTKAATLD